MARQKPHSLLFIGGLSDGLATVPYLNDIVAAVESEGWSIFSVLLSSSYNGWGLTSLDKDIGEIAMCVEYVRGYKSTQIPDQLAPGLLVLMGHSTGSQDVLHYLYSPNPLHSTGLKRPPVDGAILQAPVSDREYTLSTLKSGTGQDSPEELSKVYIQLVDMAKRQECAEGKDALLPLSMTTRIGFPEDVAITSKRFLSLVSPDSPDTPMEDDLFSSDLYDERLQQTFGAIVSRGLLKRSLLVLPSGVDEHVPAWIDKEKLLGRWEMAVKQGAGNRHIWDVYSGLVSGATHSLSGNTQAGPRRELVLRVKGYLSNIESAT